MTMQQLFFGFNGRISRQIFILGYLLLFCLQVGTSLFLLRLSGLTVEAYMKQVTQVTLGFDLVSNLIFSWSHLALGLKRLHDIGWTGMGYLAVYCGLMLVYLFALLGAFSITPNENSTFWSMVSLLSMASFVFFVIMVLLPGEKGHNGYGPDPL